MGRSEKNAQQRAIEVYDLILSGPKTAQEMADAAEIGLRGLYYILDNISTTRPLTNNRGKWYMLTSEEQKEAHRILQQFERALEDTPDGHAFVGTLRRQDAARLVRLLRRVVVVPSENE